MNKHFSSNLNISYQLQSDCQNCFGLCCVALPYAKSGDFAFDKSSGTPCKNLQDDYRCAIHKDLRVKGFSGCTTYECFGAGQKVSQITYNGKDWREDTDRANEMFDVFPIMQQLHEMLYYLNEAMSKEETQTIYKELKDAYQNIENVTNYPGSTLLEVNVSTYRDEINVLLVQSSELVRAKYVSPKSQLKNKIRLDYIGANLKGKNFKGANLRGTLFIGADLSEADMRGTDLIGVDFRAANICGTDLRDSIFLTQAQVNAATGDKHTKLPPYLEIPNHWK